MRKSKHWLRRWSQPRKVIGDAPAWLLLGTLVYVPWDYGGTHARSVFITEGLLGVILVWWAVAWLAPGRRIALPRLLVASSILILLQGWVAVWNARAFHDPDYQTFVPRAGAWSGFPSSIDQAMSLQWMTRVTVLIGVIWFAAALVRDRVWVSRLWIAIAIAGGSIAALGLLQRMTGAVLPFWEYQRWVDHFTFFATYYYHANAGAFLNLVFPVAAGLALRSAVKSDGPVQKAIWITAAVLIIVAIVANTSRMAQALGALALVAFIIGPARHQLGRIFREYRAAVIAVTAAVALVVVAVASVSIIKPTERWLQVSDGLQTNARWGAYRIACGALHDVNWFGFGPGTFPAAFSHYEAAGGSDPRGEWQHLHEDYLQTVLEWGWFGATCWGVIFFGGFACGFIALWRSNALYRRPRLARLLPLVLIALSATAVHSLVDFPLQVLSLQLIVATYLGLCWGAPGAVAQYVAEQSVHQRPAVAGDRTAGLSKK